jgi:hypothetical protein
MILAPRGVPVIAVAAIGLSSLSLGASANGVGTPAAPIAAGSGCFTYAPPPQPLPAAGRASPVGGLSHSHQIIRCRLKSP